MTDLPTPVTNRAKTVERAGIRWTVEDPEALAFWGPLWERGWEQETLDVVDAFVKPGTTFVDVGAWIGPISMWAARLGAKVVAAEPDPVARELLERNCRQNGYLVKILPVCVSDEDGRAGLEEQHGLGSSMTRTVEGTEIEAVTLQTLFAREVSGKCSLVKMDVEGHEAKILPKAGPFLAERGIPLYVSMHQPWWPVSLDPSWMEAFSRVEGEPSGFGSVLCVP